jgi:hypothetical protein
VEITKKDIFLVAGIFTATIILIKFLVGNKDWFAVDSKWSKDTQTKNIVSKLHPKFKNKIAEFFTKMEQELGLTAYATSGYRTFERQQELHNLNPNNARAGYSHHNYGFAIDINVKDKNGKIFLLKNTPDTNWIKSGVVQLAKDIGLKWGGGGAFGNYRDPVHFYINPSNLTTTDLRKKYLAGKVDSKGYVLV